MNGIFKRLLVMVIILSMVFTSVACSNSTSKGDPAEAQQADEGNDLPQIAFLFPGPVNDDGWCALAYATLLDLQEQGYETAYTENVKLDTIEETMLNYANDGYDIIFGHGFEFGESALRVAKDFPDIHFCINGKVPDSVTEEISNMSFVDMKEYESAYCGGMYAAAASESGIIGYTSGMSIPSQLANLAGFTQGARYINPDIKVIGVVAGTFDDPIKGQEIAKAQMEAGADVIGHGASITGNGVMEAAAEAGMYIISSGETQPELFPEHIIANFYTDVTLLIDGHINNALNNNSRFVWNPGIAEGIGMFEIINSDAVSPEELQKIEDQFEAIQNGTFEVEEIFDRIDLE